MKGVCVGACCQRVCGICVYMPTCGHIILLVSFFVCLSVCLPVYACVS